MTEDHWITNRCPLLMLVALLFVVGVLGVGCGTKKMNGAVVHKVVTSGGSTSASTNTATSAVPVQHPKSPGQDRPATPAPARPARVVTQDGNFATPSRNIVCNQGDPATAIQCTVMSKADSGGQYYYFVAVHGQTKVSHYQANIGTDGLEKLGYGTAFSLAGITCESQVSGLTCRNADGHGFYLSRTAQRTF